MRKDKKDLTEEELKKLKLKKRNNLTSFLYILLLLVGVGILLYPTVSNYYNSFHQSKAISAYVEAVSSLNGEAEEQMKEDARIYNKKLAIDPKRWIITDETHETYLNTLDASGTGVFGYIEIPKIDVSLPIYHTTSTEVLQVAIGHVEGSSLPIGGTGTHTVLSGHRGLPSAKLFTNLDKIEKDDIFYIYILDEVLTYQVDQILIVEPDQTDSLVIDKDQDYCTLVTCTPYGINTHRLLVRGTRIETEEKHTINVIAEATQIEPTTVVPFIAIILCFFYVVYLILKPKRKK